MITATVTNSMAATTTTLALLSLCAIVSGLQFNGQNRFGNKLDDNVNSHDINKRSEKGSDVYSHLAALSGGSVIGSNKTDVDHASSITVAEAALTSPVTVMVTHVNAATSRDVTFSVDSALTLILVEVTGHVTKSSIELSDPTGVAIDTLAVDSAGALVYKIVKPTPGNWTLHFSDKLQYDVIVKGNSDVSFQSQFVKVNPVTGYDISVPGNPPAGTNLTLAIEVNGADKTQNITSVTLYTLNGDVIKSAVLTHVGRRGALYKAAMILPAQDLRLGISGSDLHGHRFTRVLQAAVSPESEFTVTFNMTAGESSTVATDCVRLPFVVTNHGATGPFSVRVTSINTVMNPVVKPNVFTIPKGHTYTGTVTVTANMAAPSTAGDVVLTVTGPSGISDFVSTPVFIYSGATESVISASKISTSINKDTAPPTKAAISVVSKDVTTSIVRSREPTTVTSVSTADTSTGRSVSTQLPDYTSSPTSKGLPGFIASTSKTFPGSTASASGGFPGSTASTASTSGGLLGSTSSTSGELPGSTASTSGELPGSTSSTSGELPGSTASTSGELPGSTSSTSGELPDSTDSTSGGLPGSTSSTSGELPGSTASTSGELPGSTSSTSGELPDSTDSTSGGFPGPTASTSGELHGSTASASGGLPGSTASSSGGLPGSTVSTSGGLPGSTASTSGRLPGATTSTSGGLPGATASTSGGLPSATAPTSEEHHAMKPAIIASIVCGCVAAVAGVGLCVLLLTRRGLPRADSDKDHHYMDAGQYSNVSIDKGRYNAGYEMDLYQPHKG
ncbi:serine-rich adhesin for platelets-like isoform X2 [Haliotis rubra]|uniref:serine-rich adhesin for platelets-like isoform X2 n=2 Tax=Haliotis rubra TaxID=36100 RepID=UPI001EE6322E|nr:serine-rich adhesin for platelets-like isoform X2 [Haliotis rubra]